jgi:pimeloyl-ACP methyl ester carboxylesterase
MWGVAWKRCGSVAVAAVSVFGAVVVLPAAASQPDVPAPQWVACGSVSCATVRVPLDWSRPAGESITIGVARQPATRPQERIGTLLFSTGLSGSALDTLAANYPRMHAVLRERFDMVAVGQRGFPHASLAGTSTLDCGPARVDQSPLFPVSEADYGRLVAGNQALYAACRASSGALVDHLDVDSQARDWDAVRELLGVDRVSVLTFVGAGAVGQQYAARFPHRVRAMALDSPLNRAAADDRAYLLGALTGRQELARFSAWCAATPPVPNPPPVDSAPTSGCALHGQDAAAAYRAVIGSAPLTVPGIDHPLDADRVAMLLAYFLVNGNLSTPGAGGWIDLAATLTIAQRGNPLGLSVMYDASYGARGAVYGRVATCSTIPQPNGGYPAMRARVDRVRRAGGDIRGASSVWENSIGCAGWPVTDLPPVRTAVGLPSALVVSTRHNLYSPAPAVAGVGHRLAGSVVLDYDDDGHIAYLQSPCVAGVVNAYLISAIPPAPGQVCRPGASTPSRR